MIRKIAERHKPRETEVVLEVNGARLSITAIAHNGGEDVAICPVVISEEACARCGKALVVPQRLNHIKLPEGQVCIGCIGTRRQF
jgi:hypothetical protein